MAYLDLSLRLPELLLMRVDKMSMAVSLEARVPFVDHEFVALALSIPSAAPFRDSVVKAMLKKAVRGVVTDEILNRRKQGFGPPLSEWLSSCLADETRDVILRFSDESGLIDRKAAEAVIARGDSARAWCLYNLAIWWTTYFSNARASHQMWGAAQ